MIKYICDRCGREVKERRELNQIMVDNINSEGGATSLLSRNELCISCTTAHAKWIGTPPAQGGPPA